MKCSICRNIVEEHAAYLGEKGTPYEGKPLCESCYFEDDTAATVFYNRDERPYVISETRNETDEDFSVRWRNIDPWRG